jgi:hypothetical protein
MRRRPVVRKAIKSAIIVNAARRLGRRAGQHLEKSVEKRLGKH